MKACGASLEEIRSFMQLCIQGDSTLSERVIFMEHLEENLNGRIRCLEQQQKMVKFKLWYYRKSAELQDELAVVQMVPDQLPADIFNL